MRIVFFGSPDTSLIPLNKLIQEGHHIPLIVTQPDRPKGRGRVLTQCPVKRYADENAIPVIQPNKIRKDETTWQKINKNQQDINIVVAYGQIIPRTVFDFPPCGSLNIHFSLLPKYRGASPVQWALINGEKETGVTIFQLNEKMDEGDILCQEKTLIRSNETAFELEKRLAVLGADLLAHSLKNLKKLPLKPQDHSQATLAPLIKKQDGEINWTQKADRIERQIRAFDPWPSSYTYLKKTRIKIHSGEVEVKKTEKTQPGEILAIHSKGIEIACGGGSVFRVTALQPENKKPMDAYAWSLGARLKPGMFFSSKSQ